MSDLEPAPPGPAPWRDRIELLMQTQPLSPGRIGAGVAMALAILLVGWFLLRTPAGPPTEALLPMTGAAAGPSTTATTAPAVLLAHAAGAVQDPGVYELPGGSRVTDLIDAAGGPAPDADLDQLNLAAPLVDGTRVYVPRVGETVPAVVASGGPEPRLDLNTATLDQLEGLPGIGPATAQAIVQERDRRGGFRSVEDLLDVRGIGPAKLEALRDLVTV